MLEQEIGCYQENEEREYALRVISFHFWVEVLGKETLINFVTPFVLFVLGNLFLTPKISIDVFPSFFMLLFCCMEILDLISVYIMIRETKSELIRYYPFSF